MKCGLYKIVNKLNDNFYIGSSVNAEKRWKKHRSLLRHNKHPNNYLQNAWNKYGENNFYFIIEKELPHNKLKEEEQKLLDNIDFNLSYNLSIDASSPMRGRKHTKEWFVKMKGKSPINKGKTGLQDGFWKGKKLSDEHKKKLSEAAKLRFKRENAPMFGKKFSEEHKRKISETRKKNEISKGKNHPCYDDTIYYFLNKNTEETFSGTQYDFYKKYNLCQSCVHRLVKKLQKSHREWILYEK